MNHSMLITMRHFFLATLILAFALMMLPGCGKSRPKTVQIIGKVTLNGGKWPGKGAVYFVCVKPASGYVQRPGHGVFDVEGNYRAGTYSMDDGLIPGEYEVQAVYQKPHTSGDDVAPNSTITGKSKLTVPSDATAPIPFEFDVKHK